jgi:hypothetical protein
VFYTGNEECYDLYSYYGIIVHIGGTYPDHHILVDVVIVTSFLKDTKFDATHDVTVSTPLFLLCFSTKTCSTELSVAMRLKAYTV